MTISRKANGKLVGEWKKVIPKDREEALAFYLKELRDFQHKDAADFIEKYIKDTIDEVIDQMI